MKNVPVQTIADVLLVLSLILLAGDVLLMPLVPAFAYFRYGDPSGMEFQRLIATFAYDADDGLGNLVHTILVEAWQTPRTALLSLFLLVCGLCGAVLLIQGARILESVSAGTPFLPKNSLYLKRAARCCFVISFAALVRTVCGLCLQGSLRPLFSYTALFIPLFFMTGLFFLVTAPLFHSAAALKVENDLTI